MKKAGTTVPAPRSAFIVFGAPNGSRSAKAGWCGEKSSEHAAKLAAKAGLMTVRLPGLAFPKVANLVDEGGISPRGQLRLKSISREMLSDLRTRYKAQTAEKTKAAVGVNPSAEPGPRPANGASAASPPPAGGALDLGPSLTAAYRQVDVAGRWFEQVQAELGGVLEKIGASSGFSFLQGPETTDMDHYNGGEGWILDGWRWSFPARHRRQRLGDLSIVIDLGRPGRPAASLGTPCMLVMWSSTAHDWAGAIDAAAGFWPPLRTTTELLGSRLFRWTGKAPGNGPAGTLPLKDGAWFYLVRLAGITNLATLRTHVVQPALGVLADQHVDTAFAKAPDVMRFRQQQNAFVLEE